MNSFFMVPPSTQSKTIKTIRPSLDGYFRAPAKMNQLSHEIENEQPYRGLRKDSKIDYGEESSEECNSPCTPELEVPYDRIPKRVASLKRAEQTVGTPVAPKRTSSAFGALPDDSTFVLKRSGTLPAARPRAPLLKRSATTVQKSECGLIPTVTCKVRVSSDHLVRITCAREITLADFLVKTEEKFNQACKHAPRKMEEARLLWRDYDGDRITVKDQEDWELCVSESEGRALHFELSFKGVKE